MNSFEEPFDEQSADSAEFSRAEIDHMVDGELSEEQQRSLLQRLEDSPAGWRELALAYVEASVWKDQFSLKMTNTAFSAAAPLPRQSESFSGKLTTADQSTQQRPGNRQQATFASAFAAVAVLIVFGLGIWLGRTQVELPGHQPNLAEETTHDDVKTLEEQNANGGGSVDAVAVHQDIPETVQIVFSDGQSDLLRVLDVPMSNLPQESVQLDEFWDNRRSVIPDNVRAALEESGHVIRESRDFWPTQLPDGRSVVIPVSQIQFAENPHFTP
jgi:hypothetical protein